MNDWRTTWGRLRWRLGPGGLAAAAILVAGVLYGTLTFVSLHERHADLRARLDQWQQTGGAGATRGRGPADDTRALEAFYARLPRLRSAPQWLSAFDQAAIANGLVLRSGEYRLDRREGQRLLRYQIVLPVSGSYAQVRAFIDGVLAQVPAASLDEAQFSRDSGPARVVDARLRFTLYLLPDTP